MNLIKASYLRACAPFQSTENTRNYLCGVQLERHPKGGALVVATDGHVMLICHDKTGRVVQLVHTPPGLYVTEARPAGFGLSMARPRRNLLVVTFEDRRQAAGRGA